MLEMKFEPCFAGLQSQNLLLLGLGVRTSAFQLQLPTGKFGASPFLILGLRVK